MEEFKERKITDADGDSVSVWVAGNDAPIGIDVDDGEKYVLLPTAQARQFAADIIAACDHVDGVTTPAPTDYLEIEAKAWELFRDWSDALEERFELEHCFNRAAAFITFRNARRAGKGGA